MAGTVPHQHLLDRRETLKTKLDRLKANEISATVTEGDGRQEETIARVEKFLREINVEIAAADKLHAAKSEPTKKK